MKWESRATTDPDRIRAAWATGAFNVGIATGPSNLVVVDLDVPKGKGSSDAAAGRRPLERSASAPGEAVPATRTVRTATGGTHLYSPPRPASG